MGLAPEGHFGPQQYDLTFPQRYLGHGDSAIQILLTPSPSTGKGFLPRVPAHGRDVALLSIRSEPEHGARIEHDVHLLGHAITERLRVVDLRVNQRTRDVEFLARQRTVLPVGAF